MGWGNYWLSGAGLQTAARLLPGKVKTPFGRLPTSNHQTVNIGEFDLKKKIQNFKFLEEKLYLKKYLWTMVNNDLVINPQIF